MDHSLSVRVPSLVIGTEYGVKFWGKNSVFSTVRFVSYTKNGVAGGKLPQINKMTDADVLTFVGADGAVFEGVARDVVLTHRELGNRLTFFKIVEQAAPVAAKPVQLLLKGPAPMLLLAAPVSEAAPVQAFVDAIEEVVVDKAALKREKDRLRKAASRAAAKAAKLAA